MFTGRGLKRSFLKSESFEAKNTTQRTTFHRKGKSSQDIIARAKLRTDMSHHGKVPCFNLHYLARKWTDRLQLNTESVSEWPLYIFQTPLSFSSLETFALQRKQTSEVKIISVFRWRS